MASNNNIKQTLNLTQSLVMTPQLQQAIKLLQLSRMELENLITTELIDNPLLEEKRESELMESLESLKKEELKREENPTQGDEFNWDNYLEQLSSTPSLPAIRPSDEEIPNYENVLTSPTDLHSHLKWQLNLSDMDEREKKIGRKENEDSLK